MALQRPPITARNIGNVAAIVTTDARAAVARAQGEMWAGVAHRMAKVRKDAAPILARLTDPDAIVRAWIDVLAEHMALRQ